MMALISRPACISADRSCQAQRVGSVTRVRQDTMSHGIQAGPWIVKLAFPLGSTACKLEYPAAQGWSAWKSTALLWLITTIHMILECKYAALLQLLPPSLYFVAEMGFYMWLYMWLEVHGLEKLCQGLSDAAVMVSTLPSVLIAKLAHLLLLRAAVGEEFVHETTARASPGWRHLSS